MPPARARRPRCPPSAPQRRRGAPARSRPPPLRPPRPRRHDAPALRPAPCPDAGPPVADLRLLPPASTPTRGLTGSARAARGARGRRSRTAAASAAAAPRGAAMHGRSLEWWQGAGPVRSSTLHRSRWRDKALRGAAARGGRSVAAGRPAAATSSKWVGLRGSAAGSTEGARCRVTDGHAVRRARLARARVRARVRGTGRAARQAAPRAATRSTAGRGAPRRAPRAGGRLTAAAASRRLRRSAPCSRRRGSRGRGP
jgi:hypothetical protein